LRFWWLKETLFGGRTAYVYVALFSMAMQFTASSNLFVWLTASHHRQEDDAHFSGSKHRASVFDFSVVSPRGTAGSAKSARRKKKKKKANAKLPDSPYFQTKPQKRASRKSPRKQTSSPRSADMDLLFPKRFVKLLKKESTKAIVHHMQSVSTLLADPRPTPVISDGRKLLVQNPKRKGNHAQPWLNRVASPRLRKERTNAKYSRCGRRGSRVAKDAKQILSQQRSKLKGNNDKQKQRRVIWRF
jgi:hypothetical protein